MFIRRCIAGLKIGLLTTLIVMLVFTVFLWFLIVDATWENLPEVIGQDFTVRMVILLALFCFLLSFVMAFWTEKQTVECEEKVAKFAEKYKVGDSFWAIHHTIKLNDFGNRKALLNKIFHIRIKEIKKSYFTITDEFRPKWEPARIGIGDFMIFKNKSEMIEYVKKGQRILREDMKEAVESV